MAINTFLEFDTAKSDIQTDEQYAADSQRINGIATGIARSEFHNKMYRQFSVMNAAIGDWLVSKGQNANDSDKAALVTALTTAFNTYLQASSDVAISETTRLLYGLASGISNANVDKALQKTMQGGLLNALLTGWSKTSDAGNIVAADTLLKALSKLSNNIKIVTGTYTGNDVASREIILGFAPNFVLVYENNPNYSEFMFKTTSACARYDVTRAKCSITATFLCTSNGFLAGKEDWVGDSGLSSNNNGRVYNYLALAALA